MKKFLLRTFITFSLIFIFMFSVTMILEYKNKSKINSEVNVEYKVENNKIVIPDNPDKVQANYEFSMFFYFSGLAISLASPYIFYKFKGAEIIDKIKSKKNMVKGLGFCLLYGAFTEIIIFPKTLFSAFYRVKLMGLGNESFFNFVTRYLQSIAFEAIETLPIALIIYMFYIKKKRWYIYTAVLTIIITIGGAYFSPYIDEIEYDLKPMEDGEVKESIKSLAESEGIHDLDIRVIEKSSSTNSINAYMTGVGNSRRIVFWDTALKLDKNEVVSIAAHEIGHYKMGHIKKSIAFGIGMTVIMLVVLNKIMVKYKGEDYRKISNIPKLLFAAGIISVIISPVETAYSRNMEYDADEFAMEATNDGLTNGKLEITFIKNNLSPVDVNKVYKYLVYDHPTTKERIEHSNNFEEHKYYG